VSNAAACPLSPSAPLSLGDVEPRPRSALAAFSLGNWPPLPRCPSATPPLSRVQHFPCGRAAHVRLPRAAMLPRLASAAFPGSARPMLRCGALERFNAADAAHGRLSRAQPPRGSRVEPRPRRPLPRVPCGAAAHGQRPRADPRRRGPSPSAHLAQGPLRLPASSPRDGGVKALGTRRLEDCGHMAWRRRGSRRRGAGAFLRSAPSAACPALGDPAKRRRLAGTRRPAQRGGVELYGGAAPGPAGRCASLRPRPAAWIRLGCAAGGLRCARPLPGGIPLPGRPHGAAAT
jgi:hypothetical protein